MYSNLQNETRSKRKTLTIILALVAVFSIAIFSVYSIVQEPASSIEAKGFISTAGTGSGSDSSSSETETSDDGDECETDTYNRIQLPDGLYCNDGTPAIYWLDLADADSPNSDKWYIEFPGGGTCGTTDACNDRWDTRSADMTTDDRETKSYGAEGGINSPNATLNPHFHDWNRVVGHYCSSDSWLGQTTADAEDNPSDWHFMGAWIAFAMLDHLHENHHSFASASTYLTSGISVGGTGILNLADGIDRYLSAVNSQSNRYYISDCGWDIDGWKDVGCESTSDDSSESDSYDSDHVDYQIEKHEYYNANCVANSDNSRDCTWADKVYPYVEVKANVFVTQQLYDFQQLPFASASDTADLWTECQTDWAVARAEEMIESFTNAGVISVFASNCRSHDFTEHDAVYTTHLDGFGFADYVNNYVTGAETPFYKTDVVEFPESNPTCDFSFFGNDPRDDPCY